MNQGAGMEPTLVNNQEVSGFTVEASLLNRGDIIVFTAPSSLPSNSANRLIKRVIGLPGDTVSISNGSISVLTESGETYNPNLSPTPAGQTITKKVEPNSLFVIGDNTSNSLDSRFFGLVSFDDVQSRITLTEN